MEHNYLQPYFKNSKRVIARHVESSPFDEYYSNRQITYGIYADRFFPISMGENVLDKYHLLRNKALLFDVPEKPLEIKGREAEVFLDYILSRNVLTMKTNRGYYCLACNSDGGVVMDGVLFKFAKDHFWYIQADGAFECWLSAHKEKFEVEISNRHIWVLQLQGPTSIAIMNELSSGKITNEMEYYGADYFLLGNQRIYVSRTGYTNEIGFELYCEPMTDHKKLWNDLLSVGSKHGMEISSTRAMTIRRIEGGIRENLVDMDASVNPFEVGLGKFVDLNKKEFIGLSALRKNECGQLLYGVISDTIVPEIGSNIVKDGELVGTITSGTYSPTLDCGIGFVRFDFHGNWAAEKVEILTNTNEGHDGEVVDLPFFDKEKKIPKGFSLD